MSSDAPARMYLPTVDCVVFTAHRALSCQRM
jgi:hypothetical protein